MLILRDYQQTGVDLIRGEFVKKIRSTLFVLATGGGKTVIFCHVAQQTAARNKNVLILVHRVELLRQTSKALSKSNVEHGLINPKYTPNLTAPVQVASVQTLIKRLSQMTPPDLIIIDEAHHATAGSWRKVVDYFPNARILGVTATPIRGDRKGLDELFESIVVGPQTPDLIELGFLVKPIIYAPPKQIDFSEVKVVRGDYDSKQITEIMDRPTITGSAVEHYSKICPGVPCVVFCVSVSHAEHVAEDFRQKGFSAYSVDGSMDDDQRSRILSGLGDGTIQIVTSCDLISEGTDIPAIECAILLRPTQSTGLYIQQVGRALRLSEGKTRAVILDHVGNVLNHGFPDDFREWTLEGRKKGKKLTPAEKDIRAQQCEQCFGMHEPAPVCPYCGHTNKTEYKSPREVEGELIQLKRDEENKKKEDKETEKKRLIQLKEVEKQEKEKIKKIKRKEVKDAKTITDLLVIQKERGYKNGWAKTQMEMKNGKFFKK